MWEFVLGGVTHHYMSSNADKYCGKLNDSGTIVHPYAIALYGQSTKFGIITGTDSMCKGIVGGLIKQRLGGSFSLVVGGYNNNYNKFNNQQLNRFGLGGVTPVLGLNYDVTIHKHKDYTIKLNNMVSYGITTHGISLEF